MKFLFGCLLLAFMGSVYSNCYAQTETSSVKGRVLTATNAPVDGATIILLKYPDSAIVRSAISNKNGFFELNRIKPGNYLVFIRKVGYDKFYSRQYELLADKATDMGSVTLQPLNNQLNEVTVTDKRDYIEVLPDKTVLNVDRSILAAGNSVFDVLGTAPGVRIVDNTILFKGGQKALVAINGKTIGSFTDEQLADLLKSYPSSMVSQIELIENPSAKYDAASGGGVINIILKKSKDEGFRASVTETAAVGQDYKLGTGINLYYRTTKFNFFGTYTYADTKTPRMLDVDRNIFDDGQLTNIDVNYHSVSHTITNSFNWGTDYSISPKQTIGALVYGYHSQAGIDKSSLTSISNNGSLDSTLTTQSHVDRAITNLNYNLNYKGSFGQHDETSLSADFDYSTYDRSSFELVDNNFFYTDGSTYRDPLFYTDNSPSNITIRSERVDFSQALTKNSTLSLGLKNSQVNSDNTIQFDQQSDTTQNFLPIPSLTDHFVYHERINAAYGSYNDKFGNSSLTIGLRAEQTNASGISYHPDKTVSSSYFNLFPTFQLTQTLDKNNQLTIGYARNITRPNYQDLNPFVGFISQYSYSTGNPFLKPQYDNTYEVSDIFKEKYRFTLRTTISTDFSAPIYQQNDSTKVFVTTNSNIGTRYAYEAETYMPFTITKSWEADIYLDAARELYVYNLDSARKSTFDFNTNLTQYFILPGGFKLQVVGKYQAPIYYGIKQYSAYASADAAISKLVLGNSGSIKLSVTDIFNSDVASYTSNYINLDLTGREKAPTRFFQLNFTYRFGKQTVKAASKRVGGNGDDQKRLSGSTNEN